VYDLRAPLMEMQGGKLAGSVGTPAARVLEQAGVEVSLQEMPVLRQDAEVRNARQPVCAIGRLYSEERAAHGLFSVPIVRGPRYVGIVRREAPPPSPASLLAWSSRSELRWGVQAGFHYSDAIQRLMRSSLAQITPFNRTGDNLIQLLLAERIDFTLLQEDEAALLLASAAARGKLAALPLSDLPAGENRYFYCSRNVPQTTLNKLNAELVKLPLKP
jgi:hypothetical protein